MSQVASNCHWTINLESAANVQQASSGQGATGKQRKGPRPRHVPLRSCGLCREQATKRSLTRVVRQPDGILVIDLTGRMNGRGAYICEKPECWNRASSTDALAKALNVEISDAFRDELRRYGLETGYLAVESNIPEL